MSGPGSASGSSEGPAPRPPRGPVDRGLLAVVPELRRHVLIASVAAVVTAVAVVSQAEVLARGIARLVGAADGGPTVAQIAFALVVVAVVRAATVFAVERSAAAAMTGTRRRIRSAIIDQAAAGGNRTTSGLGAREATVATSGVDQMEPYVRQYLPALTQAVALPLVAGARIALADWVSAAIVIVTVPLIPIFMILIGRLTERRAQRSWAVLQRLGGHFLDVLEGLPTLRLFGRADAQAGKVREISEAYRATTMRTLRVAMLSALALELLATLSVAVIAVAVGLRLLGGGLTLTTGLVVLLLAPECYLPLRRVGASFHAAQNGLDAAADLGELLERPVPLTGSAAVPADLSIEFRDVTARNGNVRLTGTLRAEPGELIALIGPSGSGKSTLLDALRGRLTQRTGTVTVGGLDVTELDPDAWADQLTVIPQRPEPTASTVAAEVAPADRSFSRPASLTADAGGDAAAVADLVASALDAVGLAGFEQRRPEELSGGQFRRVQVARAIVAVRSGCAHVVVADEPTAQLDTGAATAVRQALRGLAADGATVLVATHDHVVADVADRVIDVTGRPVAALSAPSPATVDDVQPHRAAAVTTGAEGTPPEPNWRTPERSLRSSVAALRSVLAASNPARRRLAGAVGLGTLAEICSLGLAGVSAWLIVRASEQPEIAAVALVVTGVRGFGVGKGVFRYAERLATHDAGLRALAELRARVVDRFAAVAPAGTPDWRRGDMASRVVDDVDRLLDLYVRVLVPTLSIATATAAAALVTLLIDPLAALVLIVGVAVVAVVVPLITVLTERSIAPSLAEARSAVRSEMLDLTEHAEMLVAHRLVHRRRAAVDVVGARIDRLELRRARVRSCTSAILAAAPALTVAATLVAIGADSALAAPMIGVLALWPLATIELNSAINEAAGALPGIGDAASRVEAVLELEPPMVDEPHVGVATQPAIELQELWSAWPTTGMGVGPVDVAVPYGATVAIVGRSGSGKSTLAAALVRFCPVLSGEYLVTGAAAGREEDPAVRVDAALLHSDAVRTAVTWVEQSPWIADTTVAENLRIADRHASADEMKAALALVALDDWLAGLPKGLDTAVGRHGTAMSGGEAHRLALARVLLAGHPVVVVDEPTSHLDTATADTVMASLATHLSDRTLVLLTHDAPDLPLTSCLVLDDAAPRLSAANTTELPAAIG